MKDLILYFISSSGRWTNRFLSDSFFSDIDGEKIDKCLKKFLMKVFVHSTEKTKF